MKTNQDHHYAFPKVLSFKFRSGKHANESVRQVLHKNPNYIFKDWSFGNQDMVLRIRGGLRKMVLDASEDDMALILSAMSRSGVEMTETELAYHVQFNILDGAKS